MSDPKVAVKIVITVLDNGAMSIEGPMGDPVWMLAALDHAKDAIKNQTYARGAPPKILIPGRDVDPILKSP